MSLHDIRLWLYPGANPDGDPALWGLEEIISSYIRRPGQDGGQAIQYSGGKGDEAPGVDAGQMTLTLDDRDGRFSTDKIDGPYYGLLDTNNPIRMGVASFVDTFTRTSSSTWGSPDAAIGRTWTHSGVATDWTTDGAKASVVIPLANSAQAAVAGNGGGKDMDITTTIIPVAVATGARFVGGIRARVTDSNNYLAATISWDLLGAMRITLASVVAGIVTTLATLNPIPSATYTAGQRWRLRFQVDGQALRTKTWKEADPEPATWTLTAEDTTAPGTDIGIYVARVTGNTNSGSTAILQFDDFDAVALEFTGAVASWPLRWNKRSTNSWAPIRAAGILSRIKQGTYPIQSPLRRQLAAESNISNYIPMEDGVKSRTFTSAIAGQPAATYSDVTLAADTSLAGGGQAPVLASNIGTIMGQTTIANNGTGFSFMVLMKLGSVSSTKTRIVRLRTSRGPVPIWDFSISDANVYIDGLDTDGTVLTSASNAHTEDWTQWHAWQIETDNSSTPGSTDWSAIYHEVGNTTFWAQTGTVAGSTNSLIRSFALTGPQGTAFAHAWMGRNTLPFVTASFSLVSSGYAGEMAADRFARICREMGIPYIVRPGGSEAMGPQREAGAGAVLESCVQTDYGVMSERGSGLEYIPREARWNAAVAMAVSVAAGQINDAPEPTRDDQRLRNKWTVTNADGGSGTYSDDADILKHGILEDTAQINASSDSVLENHAAFRTVQGTVGRLRWPSVSLNFSRNRDLLPQWRNRGYGWRLTVDTGLTQVSGNEPDLIVEGFTAYLDPDNWTVDLSCSPASAWVAAVADDTGIYGRACNEYCETTTTINSTTLSIPITTTSGLRWDNTAGLWSGGVDFNVGGERITVTSISNGADPAQTLNATVRGVNGYPTTHPSGTEVTLWDRPIVAL